MTKFLYLAAASIAVFVPSRAMADIHLDLGGYWRSYALFANNDNIDTPATDNPRRFDFVHETEIHFTGERTLGNGLAVGVRGEMKLLNESRSVSVFSLTAPPQDPNQADEAFVYFTKKGWGELSFGARDGAAFLLQVGAPAADENVDGLRVWVQGWVPDTWDDGAANGSFAANGFIRLDYDNADFGKSERAVYLSPAFHGFRAGISYAPENGQGAVNDALAGMSFDDRPGRYENILDLALRYDEKFGDWRVQASAIHAGANTETAAPAGAFGSDDLSTWDLGLKIGWKEWSLGAALMGSSTGTSGPDSGVHIWVAGAAWDRHPWHIGASVYDFRLDSNAFGAGLADDIHLRRYTAGGGWIAAPGLRFNAAAQLLDVDNGANSPVDPLQTQFTLGSELRF